jgi:lysophospholipase L1-like esterase
MAAFRKIAELPIPSPILLAAAALCQVFGCNSPSTDEGGTNTNVGGTTLGLGGQSNSSTAPSSVVGFGGATSATSRSAGGTNQTSPGTDPAFGGTSNMQSKTTGGTTAIGGRSALGGANSTGGTSTTGGKSAFGGTSTTGGKSAFGGTTSRSGTLSAGGSSNGGGKSTLGGASSAGGATSALPNVTVYIAGDSTVSNYTDTSATNDQAGWGQMLKGIFNSKVSVVNRAAGGRTAYWFYLEGGVADILSVAKKGDYFFIQFGTNDQNTTATFTVNGTTYPRLAEADTTFKTQLKTYYLDPIRAKGIIPVLVTPPPRNSAYCSGGNGLSAYATAMVQLGAAENVTVLDNNLKTFNYLKAICPKPTTAAEETFFLGKTDGSIDGTHFQENGARKMAGFIGTCIKETSLGLSGYLL